MTTRPAAQCLYNASLHLPFFHLEDVFLTGFAAENCAIPRYHSESFHPNTIPFSDFKESDIVWHYLNIKALKNMHKIFMYDKLSYEYQKLQDHYYQLEQD